MPLKPPESSDSIRQSYFRIQSKVCESKYESGFVDSLLDSSEQLQLTGYNAEVTAGFDTGDHLSSKDCYLESGVGGGRYPNGASEEDPHSHSEYHCGGGIKNIETSDASGGCTVAARTSAASVSSPSSPASPVHCLAMDDNDNHQSHNGDTTPQQQNPSAVDPLGSPLPLFSNFLPTFNSTQYSACLYQPEAKMAKLLDYRSTESTNILYSNQSTGYMLNGAGPYGPYRTPTVENTCYSPKSPYSALLYSSATTAVAAAVARSPSTSSPSNNSCMLAPSTTLLQLAPPPPLQAQPQPCSPSSSQYRNLIYGLYSGRRRHEYIGHIHTSRSPP